MRLIRPSSFKHLVLAAMTLVGSLCTLEVALAIRQMRKPACESLSGPCPIGFERSQLLERSWVAHHRLRPLQTVSARTPSGETLTLTTSSFGLRAAEVDVPKPPGTFRVLVLGDEAVFAAEVPEAETLAARLQELLRMEMPGAEVLNGGVPGYCPLLSFLAFRHELHALQPDLVILNVDMADIADDHRYRRLTHRHNEQPVACPHPDLASTSQKGALRNWDRFQTVQWARRRIEAVSPQSTSSDDEEDIDALEGRTAWLRDEPPDWSVYVDQALEPIEALARLLDAGGGQLLVTAIPAPWQVSDEASSKAGVREAQGVAQGEKFGSRAPFERIAAWCRQRQIAFVDVSPVFQSDPDGKRLYLAEAARLSPLGHELAARQLAESIAARLTGPRPRNPWAPRYAPPPRSASGHGAERR